ncbi:MAG: hypothetical protein Q9227_006407 [Pyrenula ochraceoflavens]
MPSTRRLKALVIVVFVAVFLILYHSSNARNSRNEYLSKTLKAMEEKASKHKAEDQKITEMMDNASKMKGNPGPDVQVPVEEKPKAPHKVGDPKTKPLETIANDEEPATNTKSDTAPKTKQEVENENFVTNTLNDILKRSPIIIFSKTTCPFSRKAKQILLEKYNIIPAPYVVEIDQETDKKPASNDDPEAPTLGQRLQATLAKMSGRKTVPNILISGRSIGGGDEVEQLDKEGKLEKKIRDMAGKRIIEVSIRG